MIPLNFPQWKKLTVAIATALFIYLNKRLNLGLDETTITQIALVAASYIVGQGLADAGKNAAAINAEATVTAASIVADSPQSSIQYISKP